MIKNILDWLDERTGWRKIKEVLLDRHIPKGVGWRYTLGSITLFLFLLELFTGILLAMHYSPSPDHAYDSVNYLTHQVPMGDFLRSLHKWGAYGMVVAIFLHLFRVFFMGSYKYPREVTWLTGGILLFLVIGFSFTGYLLPWNQKAYWATTVGVQMVDQVPILGGALANIMRGGENLGAITLARFYAIHVLVFPILALLFIVIHLFLVVWHGISAPPERDPSLSSKDPQWKQQIKTRYAELKAQGKSFWPYIIFKDTIAVTLVFIIVAALALWKGADVGSMADPTTTNYNPRPEWYFLCVFQFLKFFPGKLEVFAIVLLPLVVVILLFTLPFWDGGPKRHPADRKWLVAGGWMAIIGIIVLTIQGAESPLVNAVIPQNPLVLQGQRLFQQLNCLYCHSLNGQGGTVGPALDNIGSERSATWLAAHFRNPKAVTPGSKMPTLNLLDNEVDALVAYMQSLGGGTFSANAPGLFEQNCASCHQFHGVGQAIGPDLSNVGKIQSAAYIAAYITSPTSLNKDAAMSGFEGQLTVAQIQDLANYLFVKGR